jgi:DNA polymerase I-like protein with 3'-5' exonuclease and polymerase domains
VNIQQVFKPGNQRDKFCNCGAPKDSPHSERCFGQSYIIRQLMIPDDDCVLAATDGSQLQFRAFAHYSNDTELIAAYLKNWDVDFHQMVADLFSLTRQAAKHNNFAMVLGMGREKLADRLGLSCECQPREWWSRLARMKIGDREERQRHIFGFNSNHSPSCPACKSNDMAEEYDRKFPAAKKTMEKVTAFAEGKTRKDEEGRGFVRSLLGRRCRAIEGDKYYSFFAKLLQMSEADLVKSKINTLYKNREVLGIKKLRCPVHDEAVYDVLKDNYDRNLRRINEATNGVVERGVRMRVPMIWESKLGPNWSQMKKSPYSFKNLDREVAYQ